MAKDEGITGNSNPAIQPALSRRHLRPVELNRKHEKQLHSLDVKPVPFRGLPLS